MRKLVSVIVAALFAAVTLSVFAADPVKTGDDPNKPGRQIDDGTVKAGGDTTKPGRAADEEKAGPAKKDVNKKKKKKKAE